MSAGRDDDDLESLFEQISSETLSRLAQPDTVDAGQTQASSSATAALLTADNSKSTDDVDAHDEPPEVFQRVGSLTRQLHDALRQLGYDKQMENAVSSLPDARDRLAYIARLTGQAADKALSAVEQGQTLQDGIALGAGKLSLQWDQLFKRELTVEEFAVVARETQRFLHEVSDKSRLTNNLFSDIMMAQDFHDLTGQVIQKVVKVAQKLEEQLVQLLLDTTPPERRVQVKDEWLSGPVISGEGRDDVVVNQQQVDDLLGSLGF